MDSHIFIALIGALLNALLSVTVPCLVRKTESDLPFLMQVKRVFDTNRQVVMTSSLIVGITIYLALKVAPEVQPFFSDLTGLNIDSATSSDFIQPRIIATNAPFQNIPFGSMPLQLKNLVRLNGSF